MGSLKSFLRDGLIRAGRVATAELATRLDVVESRLSTAPPIRREAIAAHFLRGRGLEIGALHRPLAMPPGVSVQYIDTAPLDVLQARFPDVTNIISPDIIDDGERLASIPDAQYDFVVANHFLEHAEDPFAALANFTRVLRPGGNIFMAVPDKRWTFDRDRDVTTFEHLLRDHREGPETSRRAHYEEWLRVIDGFEGEVLAERTEAFIRDRVNIHFHVWTIGEMGEMFLGANSIIGLPLEIRLAFADPPMSEVVWVLEVCEGVGQKSAAPSAIA